PTYNQTHAGSSFSLFSYLRFAEAYSFDKKELCRSVKPLIPVLWLWLRRQHLFHVVHVLDWWQGSSGCTSGPGTKLAKGLAKV
ncbi:MAG: hypothetical protein ACK559_02570, partial [bacterium]